MGNLFSSIKTPKDSMHKKDTNEKGNKRKDNIETGSLPDLELNMHEDGNMMVDHDKNIAATLDPSRTKVSRSKSAKIVARAQSVLKSLHPFNKSKKEDVTKDTVEEGEKESTSAINPATLTADNEGELVHSKRTVTKTTKFTKIIKDRDGNPIGDPCVTTDTSKIVEEKAKIDGQTIVVRYESVNDGQLQVVSSNNPEQLCATDLNPVDDANLEETPLVVDTTTPESQKENTVNTLESESNVEVTNLEKVGNTLEENNEVESQPDVSANIEQQVGVEATKDSQTNETEVVELDVTATSEQQVIDDSTENKEDKSETPEEDNKEEEGGTPKEDNNEDKSETHVHEDVSAHREEENNGDTLDYKGVISEPIENLEEHAHDQESDNQSKALNNDDENVMNNEISSY